MVLCYQVTRIFILSTLGLFDFSVVQVPNANQYRLAETGSSQKHLSRFEAIGLRPFFSPSNSDGFVSFYMYREEDGVRTYMKVGNSSTDYRLTVTSDYDERSTFKARRRGAQSNVYDIVYDHPSNNDERWYLQGVFPIVNGTVDHGQAYARVGERSSHYNISGNIVPLSALATSNTCGEQQPISEPVIQNC